MAQTASGDVCDADLESGNGGEAVFEALAELEGLVLEFDLTATLASDALEAEVGEVLFEYDWLTNNAWMRAVDAFLEDVVGVEVSEVVSAVELDANEGAGSGWSDEQCGVLSCAEARFQGAANAGERGFAKLLAGGCVCDVRQMVVRWRRKKRRSLRAMRVRREASEKKAEGGKRQQRLQVLKVLGRFRQWQRHGRHRWESSKQGEEMVEQGRMAWENRVVRRVWSWWNWRLVEGGRKKDRAVEGFSGE